MTLKEFIEVTSICDGKRACIRAALIESVEENAEEKRGDMRKYECRTIFYAGHAIDVIEEYDDILDMIYKAEM